MHLWMCGYCMAWKGNLALVIMLHFWPWPNFFKGGMRERLFIDKSQFWDWVWTGVSATSHQRVHRILSVETSVNSHDVSCTCLDWVTRTAGIRTMTEGKGHLPPEREVPPNLLSINLHQCILQTHGILHPSFTNRNKILKIIFLSLSPPVLIFLFYSLAQLTDFPGLVLQPIHQ